MKITTLSILACASLVTTLTATAGVQTCMPDSDQHAIAVSYNSRWVAALIAAEPEAISRLYTESAILMPPSDETIVGREPISAYLNAHPGPATAAGYQIELVSCEVRGNALHIAGVWGAADAGTPATGLIATGNLLRVLEPGADGEWIASYEIWN